MAIGLTFPLSKTTGSIGHFEVTPDILSAAREDLKSLIFTNWGERVNHYYMGCNLREFLFESMIKEELRSKIGERIVSQVETWLPFISVTSLFVNFTEDDSNIPENGIGLRIEFKFVSKQDLSSRLEIVVTQ